MKDLHLYIGSSEVEFSTPPEVLYTYQETDTTNPTIIKNSFSKTITIEGTPANNQLFGEFWSVERLQNTSYEGSGVYFNASRKVPFQLFLDSELYESGYVKLDNVITNGGKTLYNITLYGGLGDFFFVLNTTEEGEKKKLSDLVFDTDIEFTANIDTVKEAWDNLGGDNEKWNTINFMTAYNGYPEDFDNNRVIINTNGTNLVKAKTDGGKTYYTTNGFVLGELPSEMTEWEIRDLRSYLQRPVIRMKSIIEACFKQENNGGYEVVLDEDFFNKDNPYWNDTWLTLPIISNLKYSVEEQILQSSNLIALPTEGTATQPKVPLMFDIGNFSQQTPSSIKVKGKVRIEGGKYHKYTSWVHYTGKNSNNLVWGKSARYGSLYCQLIALNGDTVVGASEAYNLTSPVRHDGNLRFGNNSRYESGYQFNSYLGKPIYDILGQQENNYWCWEGSTTPYELSFTINNCNSNVTRLEMIYFWGSSKDKRKADGVNGLYDEPYENGILGSSSSWAGVGRDSISFEVTYSNVKGVLGDDLGRTGTEINKETLLNTESTPCEYLLSYCKMFGLHFRKELDSNRIFIETRKTFYNRGEIIDLSQYIDRASDIEITPLAFDTKWYQYKQEAEESGFYKGYLSSKGIEYGSKLINTGYEFIADKKNILEGNVIKSAIEGLEKSKYYTAYNNDNNIRSWFGMGLKYNLYNGSDKIEVLANTASAGDLYGINDGEGMKYYDLIPKIQLHKDNDGLDGNNVLVFFSGKKNVINRANPISYYLTDDTTYQNALNEGTPCWLFTNSEMVNGKRIAYRLSELPVFERYLTSNGSYNVEKSLDFGTPQELYVPNYSITDGANIYDNFWKTYIEDLYDVNTRILKCRVKLDGKPNPEWLRRFYWFDNVIWRLNKIVDWNISSDGTTLCEFIKVEETSNYTSVTQDKGKIDIWFGDPPSWILPPTLNDIPIKVWTEIPEIKWELLNPQSGNIENEFNYVTIDKTSGEGTGDVMIRVEANTSNTTRPIHLTVVGENGVSKVITLYQLPENNAYFDVQPDNVVLAPTSFLDINFNWFNQGTDYVDDYVVEGTIEVSVEIGDDDTAIMSVGENNTHSVNSGTLTFISKEELNDTIGIDILPKEITFNKDGGVVELLFTYNTPRVENVPYWLTASVIGKTLTLQATPNLYKDMQSGSIIVNGAVLSIKQEGGGIDVQPQAEVSPKSLYFNAEGGLQYLIINIPNTWIIIENAEWVTTNIINGDGKTVISVAVPQNDGEGRSYVLKVKDAITKVEHNVYVTQVGIGTTRTFSINPTSLNVPSNGGTYSVSIYYEGRDGDYVDVEGTEGYNYGDITWQGDVGTISLTIPANTTADIKEYSLTFTSSIGTEVLTITQEGKQENITLNKTMISVSAEGGDNVVRVNSNSLWVTETSAGWIRTNPTSGEGEQDVFIEVDANTIFVNRVGYIYFKSAETNTTLATIQVTQDKLIEVLSVSPSTIDFSADGGTATIRITANGDWTISEIE